jgi:hypothetical protein
MKIKMEIEYTVEELLAAFAVIVTAQHTPPEGYCWEGRLHAYRDGATFKAVRIGEDTIEGGSEG